MPPRADRWTDARTAAALCLVDPAGLGGVLLRARHGPARERWLAAFDALLPATAPRRRIAATIEPGRLVGGLDFAATLAAGRSVMEAGVLAAAAGGALIVAMAERLPRGAAALIAGALDRGTVRVERDGFSAVLAARFTLVALDEGVDDEAVPALLAERLAFRVELEGLAVADCAASPFDAPMVAQARRRLPSITMPDDLAEALAGAAPSVRRALFLCRAARAHAALRGAEAASRDDAVAALRLVLGAELTTEAPPAEAAPEPAAPPPPGDAAEPSPDGGDDGPSSGSAPTETIVEAAAATLPQGLLDAARVTAEAPGFGDSGRARDGETSGARGRSIGTFAGRPAGGARIDVVATLRAAAPWQRLRRPDAPPEAGRPLMRVTVDDFRHIRRRQPRGATAIFAVDASGSAASARLAETKGAIELLLAECYVRRDEVALIAFRGREARTLLEPTRSLVRAKRSLASLPGGGPTPLASGIEAATRLAHGLGRRGRDAIAVFLTDGRGNVARDGSHGRDGAMEDASRAARHFRSLGLRGVVIDTGARPRPAVGLLARDLGADYVALPRGGPERISAELAARLAR